ncbi:MAG: AAA family ATPase [Nitrososphaeria archaeon]
MSDRAPTILGPRIPEVRDLIIDEYEALLREGPRARPPILLLGPPGVGKSTVVRAAGEEIARRHNRKFIDITSGAPDDVPEGAFLFLDLRLTNLEPSDLTGLPREKNGFVKFIPVHQLYLFSRYPGVIFLDELTWIQRDDMMAVVPQLLLDHRVGSVAFRDDVMVVAAGNRAEDTPLARALPAPTLNRLTIVEVQPPTVEEWAAYMDAAHPGGWNRKILAYLEAFRGDFIRSPPAGEGFEGYPTPRSWEWAALLPEGVPEWRYVALLGREVGLKLSKFLTVRVDVIALLRNPSTWRGLELEERYMALSEISERLRAGGLKPDDVMPLLTVLEDEFVVVLLVLLGPGPVRSELVARAARRVSLAARLTKIMTKITG